MTAEIIHDDDVSRRERGDQNLIDIGLKPDAVDRASRAPSGRSFRSTAARR